MPFEPPDEVLLPKASIFNCSSAGLLSQLNALEFGEVPN
jgi:hypothetical protein